MSTDRGNRIMLGMPAVCVPDRETEAEGVAGSTGQKSQTPVLCLVWVMPGKPSRSVCLSQAHPIPTFSRIPWDCSGHSEFLMAGHLLSLLSSCPALFCYPV